MGPVKNDAPALTAAGMGVAMGLEGTDVAGEAADVIVADDNFATIITAVRVGPVVWNNLRKELSVNTPIDNAPGRSVLFFLIFRFQVTPLTSIQRLYCKCCDFGFVCAFEPAQQNGIMDLPPPTSRRQTIDRKFGTDSQKCTYLFLTCNTLCPIFEKTCFSLFSISITTNYS